MNTSNTKTTKNNLLRFLPVAAVLLFIWINSMMPASVSSMESGFFVRLLSAVVEPVRLMLAKAGVQVTADFLIRKAAHMTEYAVLGITLYFFFRRADGRGRFLPTAGCALAAALLDEGIQMFSEGRGPGLRDVCIDFCGAMIGLGVIVLVMALWHRYKESKQAKN